MHITKQIIFIQNHDILNIITIRKHETIIFAENKNTFYYPCCGKIKYLIHNSKSGTIQNQLSKFTAVQLL